MDAFIKDFDKVLKRKRQLDKETLASIDSIISSLSSSAPLCVETASNLSESYRDMQQSIFKYQKQVDKRFKQDLDLELVKGAFDDKGQVVDKILANHFIRQGQFNVANSLAAETHTQIDPENTRLFSDMFTIVQGLKYKRVEAALEWCRLHSDKLEHNGSSLHFELHKVSYLSLVKQGALPACIQYAKKEFPKFATKHFKGFNS